jgi:hypothetical protein
MKGPKAALVYSAGEINVIEYGSNEILGICRTEYMNPRLVRYFTLSLAIFLTTAIEAFG